ncbi:MAG: ferritin family protein [Eubacteriales bacterium]|nr:ferritin family protein [Eubacteriales bacterium]MDD4104749.1 ferritin family protein [Eubacteriales bacterium]MDD4710234.1 ferritin family protein [Eubacteriales bacterium]NLO15165.1 NADH peroxidase [Clostridiales bacterium]
MKWVCKVCGYVYEGAEPPDICPVCKAPKDAFEQHSEERSWADDHRIGAARGLDERVVKALREELDQECRDEAMYLAMSRAADREGHPEIGSTYQRVARERMRHAAILAEILGDDVSDSSEKNLAVRVEAEYAASKRKKELAVLTKELGYDGIHDALHEMSRDNSRHGKMFLGLLRRYFNH